MIETPKFQYLDYVYKKTKDFYFCGRVICSGMTLKGGIRVYLVQDPHTLIFTVASEGELQLYERPAVKLLPEIKPSKY